MALFHLSVTQVRRSAGQSAIASAAYRAGERLYSERYGEYSDYTRKGGVICSDILLPPQAPPEYQDRQTLWNAVEEVERHKDAQLAYSFDIALQNEFSLEENIALARQFLLEQFVSRGMVADFAVHQPDKEDGAYPTPTSMCFAPSGPFWKAADGAANSGASTVWTGTATAYWTRRASPSLTRFPPPTGAARKHWNTGGRRGPRCATPSLRKRACPAGSTTVPISAKA